MSDYMVGRKSGGKDRFMVGWNESKQNANAYKVGGGGSSVSESSNSKLGGGDQASPAGQKSAFNYAGEVDPKDVGDKSPNMNMGGAIQEGIQQNAGAVGGDKSMVYSEKGSWDDGKNAMARRKAEADAAKRYYSANPQYDSPVPQVDPVKK